MPAEGVEGGKAWRGKGGKRKGVSESKQPMGIVIKNGEVNRNGEKSMYGVNSMCKKTLILNIIRARLYTNAIPCGHCDAGCNMAGGAGARLCRDYRMRNLVGKEQTREDLISPS